MHRECSGFALCAPRNDSRRQSAFTFTGAGCSAAAEFATRAAFAMPASAALRLLRVGAGLHHAGGHDQGRGVLGGHLDFDDLALGHVEEEAGGRVRRARQEHRDVLLLAGQFGRDVHARRLRDQHDRPHARRGKFDQADTCGSSSPCPRTASRTPASGRDRSRAPPACGRAAFRRDRPASGRSGWRRGSPAASARSRRRSAPSRAARTADRFPADRRSGTNGRTMLSTQFTNHQVR